MSKHKRKYYVVWKGAHTGVFSSWEECQKQVNGVLDAKYKSFESLSQAEEAYKSDYKNYIGTEAKNTWAKALKISIPYAQCLCVDAACNMQKGDMEYRGVHYPSGIVLFHQKDFKEATNNIGEFLALVHGLAYLLKNSFDMPIYTDSKTALSWLRQKRCKTEQMKTSGNEHVFEMIQRAEKWLLENDYRHVKVLKWETEHWGEIPADFGRK